MLGLDGITQRHYLVSTADQQDRIEICAAYTHVRCHESKAGPNDLIPKTLCQEFSAISVQQLIRLTVQAPNCHRQRMIEAASHKVTARKLPLEIVLYSLEQGQHLQHSIVVRISTVNGRHLFICHLDEAVTRGNTQAVVQDLRKHFLGYLVQCMSGDSGTLQNRLQCAGAYGILLPVDAEHNACVLHRISQDFGTPIMLI